MNLENHFTSKIIEFWIFGPEHLKFVIYALSFQIKRTNAQNFDEKSNFLGK